MSAIRAVYTAWKVLQDAETRVCASEFDAADSASAWNKRFPSRPWDTQPDRWTVLDALTAAERALLAQLQVAHAQTGNNAMDISIAKVRQCHMSEQIAVSLFTVACRTRCGVSKWSCVVGLLRTHCTQL